MGSENCVSSEPAKNCRGRIGQAPGTAARLQTLNRDLDVLAWSDSATVAGSKATRSTTAAAWPLRSSPSTRLSPPQCHHSHGMALLEVVAIRIAWQTARIQAPHSARPLPPPSHRCIVRGSATATKLHRGLPQRASDVFMEYKQSNV